MYALLTNGAISRYPYSITDLRRDNPQTSFPAEPSDSTLVDFGAVRVYFSTQPSFDPDTQALQEDAPAYVAPNSRWEQVWSVRQLTAEELAQKQQQVQDQIVVETQARLDTFAQTRNYDGILSTCTYANSPTLKFQQEGQYAIQARDATWSTLYSIMLEVQAGTRPMPSGYADIEADLPVLVWP